MIASPFPPVLLPQNRAVPLEVPVASAPRKRQRQANLTAPRCGPVAQNRVHPETCVLLRELFPAKGLRYYTILTCRHNGCESDRADALVQPFAQTLRVAQRPGGRRGSPNDTKQVLQVSAVCRGLLGVTPTRGDHHSATYPGG